MVVSFLVITLLLDEVLGSGGGSEADESNVDLFVEEVACKSRE